MAHLRLLKAACLLSSGILIVVGLMLGQPPASLLKGQVVVFTVGAAIYGFTGYFPRMDWLFRLRPIQGVLLVALGSAALFVPAQFLLSACLLGVGFRKLWVSACAVAEGRPGTTVVHPHQASTPARS